MAEFIVNRRQHVVSNTMKTAWDMKNADATLQRLRKSRMLLLGEAGEVDCVDGCDRWPVVTLCRVDLGKQWY